MKSDRFVVDIVGGKRKKLTSGVEMEYRTLYVVAMSAEGTAAIFASLMEN